MPSAALFGISAALGFVLWGIITWQFIWPALSKRPRADALRPILLLHGFRFVGLAFVIPGVASAQLPAAFAQSAAYGDLAASILALLAIAALGSRLEPALIWAFNLVGTADLLYAFYQGNRVSLALAPGLLGATYFLPTVLVPLLLITHVVVFRLMLRTNIAVPSRTQQRAA